MSNKLKLQHIARQHLRLIHFAVRLEVIIGELRNAPANIQGAVFSLLENL